MAIQVEMLQNFRNHEEETVEWLPGFEFLRGKSRRETTILFQSWAEFAGLSKGKNSKQRTIVSFSFQEAKRNEEGEIVEVSLDARLFDAQKGSVRRILIQSIREEELEEVRTFLSGHFVQVLKWFDWSGSY